MQNKNAIRQLSTLIDLLRLQAADQPDQRAFTFLHENQAKQHLTYAALDQQAQSIAAQLQQCASVGQRALLLFPPGLAYIIAFFGCLYAGIIAVPTYPPRRNRPDPRLQSIVKDATATLVLTTHAMLTQQTRFTDHMPELKLLHWCATDAPAPTPAADWRPPAVRGQTLALLQYTSGSTGRPKGVMVSHANLLHNAAMVIQAYQVTAASSVVSWLPPYHDMGLIGNIIQPVYAGIPSTLMSPQAFIQQPLRWLQTISDERASTSGGPDFAYDLCVRKISATQRASLDLSCWEIAFSGAEPIRAATLDRFAQTFHSCGFRRHAFYPCYGMAEATLFISGGEKTAPPIFAPRSTPTTPRNVGCGHTWLDQHMRIVDPDTASVLPGTQIGEIWVTGPSVCQGYWRQPEASRNTFQAYLHTGEGPFLRTGDLGFINNQELFITGRRKDLIIIRGQNHSPQDIERTVEQSHAALRPNCVAAVSMPGESERLAIVAELERRTKPQDYTNITQQIRQAVAAQHQLQTQAIVLLKMGRMPKTSSGKIQRFACRQHITDKTFQPLWYSTLQAEPAQLAIDRTALLRVPVHARQTVLTTHLQRLVAAVLGTNEQHINAEQSLSQMGIDSLAAAGLQHRIETALEISWPLSNRSDEWCLTALAANIIATVASQPAVSVPALQPISRTGAETLSFAQRRFWLLQQMDGDSANYNLPAAWEMTGVLDQKALRHALANIVARHDTLRTTFFLRDGDPVQTINPNLTIPLSVLDLQAHPVAARRQEARRLVTQAAHRPFNLATGPLLRPLLLVLDATHHIFMITTHHIIFDGWSESVFMQELASDYQACVCGEPSALAKPSIQYVDYAHWQQQCLKPTRRQHLLDYWLQQLAHAPPYLDLPTDHPRPLQQNLTGTGFTFTVPTLLHPRMTALNAQYNTTVFMTLLTTFATLLSRYSGQHDMVIGTGIATRPHQHVERLIGLFANSLALRIQFADHLSFAQLLTTVRDVTTTAYAHADLPFEQVLEAVQPVRDPSRSPLFQVMFTLQNAIGQHDPLPGITLQPFDFDVAITQYDLSLHIFQQAQGLQGVLLYRADLFEAKTISRMAGHYLVLLQAALAQPNTPLAQLPLLTQAEIDHLAHLNTPSRHTPAPVDDLSEAQVEALLSEML